MLFFFFFTSFLHLPGNNILLLSYTEKISNPPPIGMEERRVKFETEALEE